MLISVFIKIDFLIEEYVAQYVELMSARIKKQVGRTL